MNRALRLLTPLFCWMASPGQNAQAAPTSWETALDPRWAPQSIGTPPRPSETGATLPEYGEDRHGSLAQDMAALGGVIGGAIVPITMTMVKWGQTYDERSLNLKQKHRDEASELLRTYGLTSAIVAPLTSWTGFMAGGGYRQQPVRALLCGVGAAAISYPVGSYLGRAVADPVLNSDKGTPRYPDRTIFLGSLVWTGVIASSTIAGVAIGGGAIIRKTRDPGYALMVVPDGKNTLLVHSFSGQF